jgi:hypothetical protein
MRSLSEKGMAGSVTVDGHSDLASPLVADHALQILDEEACSRNGEEHVLSMPRERLQGLEW